MSTINPPKAPLKEFERWREACEDKSLEPEDYLGTLVEATEFPDEALVVLMSMVWPRLMESDGRVYLESRFTPHRLTIFRMSTLTDRTFG